MKKLAIGMSIVLMTISLLTACGGKNTPPASSPKPVETNPQETQNAEEADVKKDPTKFSISLRSLAVNYVDNHANINEDVWVKRLEELTNTDLDIRLIPHAEYEQKMAQMFAINDIPDVVQASGGTTGKELAGSVEAGIFMPLDDLLQEHGQDLLNKIPAEVWDYQKIDGKIYAIPDWLHNTSRRATVIRTDLLEKTGLPIPKTVDEYLDVMREFKKLGVEHPFQARENLKYADVFFGAFDAFAYNSMFIEQDGQIVPKFFDVENMQNAIQSYNTMYNEGLISKEFATINPATYKNNILAGKAGIWNMNANEVLQWEQQIQETTPEARLAIITSPTGTDGKGGNYMYAPMTRNFLINANTDAEKAADIVKFLNWMVNEEAETFFTYGWEGETYTLDNGVVNYKQPEDAEGVNLERYRTFWLWFVQDQTYVKGLMEQTPEGQELMGVYDSILAKEGRDGIKFEPRLQSYQDNPDIAPLADVPAPLIIDHIIKMIYGKEPISDWPKVIEEWKSKGGDAVIKEATERFNNKDGVFMPQN
ncbi:MAG TPA: extracellular solute-binding protein [Candidatus Paenibacillus intestinavium]|nr:extracellular solute-binding protein [Candidatus Paenibacillus intestinavium]